MSFLAGKRVLVTGASSGFGYAIAVAFAEAGADVALLARREERLTELAELVRAKGVQAVVCAADLAEETEIHAAVAKVKSSLGTIDVLVNNAGTNVMQRTVQETSSEQFRLLLEVNLTAAFVLTKALLPDMIAQGQGTIINVASRAALNPGLTGGVGYSASKMGMDALTQITNQEANRHNIRACLLCPGVGNTPILDRRPAPPPLEQRSKMLQPEDVAAVAVLVASLPPRVNVDLVSVIPTYVE